MKCKVNHSLAGVTVDRIKDRDKRPLEPQKEKAPTSLVVSIQKF